MSLSQYLESRLLDLVVNNSTNGFPAITAVFASLHTADPGENGTLAPLASCSRMAVVFNATATTSGRTNATTVDFVTSASATITHLGLWDGSATATANHLVSGALTATKAVNVGDTIRLSSAQLTFTFS